MQALFRRVIPFVGLTVVALVVRSRAPKLRERCAAGCERMLERMPEDFPPKRMLRGIEDLRADTARIIELLEGSGHTGAEPTPAKDAARTGKAARGA